MDVNVRVFRVVQAAIARNTEMDTRKVTARNGGLAGGRARAKSMSAERRLEIAKKANRAR